LYGVYWKNIWIWLVVLLRRTSMQYENSQGQKEGAYSWLEELGKSKNGWNTRNIMKYHKTSYNAQSYIFLVTFVYGSSITIDSQTSHPKSHLDSRGGSVTLARETFLDYSIMHQYIWSPINIGRKYCFSSLKARKKKLQDEIKCRGKFTMKLFLKQTDMNFSD